MRDILPSQVFVWNVLTSTLPVIVIFLCLRQHLSLLRLCGMALLLLVKLLWRITSIGIFPGVRFIVRIFPCGTSTVKNLYTVDYERPANVWKNYASCREYFTHRVALYYLKRWLTWAHISVLWRLSVLILRLMKKVLKLMAWRHWMRSRLNY